MSEPTLNNTQNGQLLDLANVQSNKKKFVTLMDKISLINGVMAGILQLESFTGFANFAIVYTATICLYVVWICQSKPTKYYVTVWNDLLFENMIRHLLNFIMSWTFAYAMVG